MLNGLSTNWASLLLFWVAFLVQFEYALETKVAVSARHNHSDLLTILTDDASVIIVHLLLLQMLLPHLLFDVETERDPAQVGLHAALCVEAAQGDKLLANRAAPTGLALAALSVRHDTLHLLALERLAVGVGALAGMDQGLDTLLNGDLSAATCVSSVFWLRAFRSLHWPLKS